jgi:hypothetical protein
MIRGDALRRKETRTALLAAAARLPERQHEDEAERRVQEATEEREVGANGPGRSSPAEVEEA